MRDCKFCNGALAYDNHSDVCYRCRVYMRLAIKMTTEWLLECLEKPTIHMLPEHVAIARDVLESRNGGKL
jgi:hypothetical protein